MPFILLFFPSPFLPISLPFPCPLVNCWPTPTEDGSCEVNIEYELENDQLILEDVIITIPLP